MSTCKKTIIKDVFNAINENGSLAGSVVPILTPGYRESFNALVKHKNELSDLIVSRENMHKSLEAIETAIASTEGMFNSANNIVVDQWNNNDELLNQIYEEVVVKHEKD